MTEMRSICVAVTIILFCIFNSIHAQTYDTSLVHYPDYLNLQNAVPADVNGDGHMDFFTESFGKIMLFENKGDGYFNHIDLAEPTNGTTYLLADDLNNDGYIDFVNCSFQRFSVYLNSGDNLNFSVTENLVWSSCYGATLGDIDSDGDVDAVLSFSSDVLLIKLNDGNGNFIDSSITTSQNRFGQLSIIDFDKDGQNDIIGLNTSNGQLYLYTQNGSTFTETQLGSDVTSISSFDIADLDSDNDWDIGLTSSANEITCLRDTGSGPLATETLLALSTSPSKVWLKDIDGQNDCEIAYRTYTYWELYWHDGTNYQADPLNRMYDRPSELMVMDYDQNGLLDVIFADTYGNDMVVLYQNSLQSLTPTTLNPLSAAGATDIDVNDINGDGFKDVIMNSDINDHLFLYAQDSLGHFQPEIIFDSVDIEVLETTDLNGDSLPDITCTGDYNTFILLNNGNGFDKVDIVSGTYNHDIGDIDGDGDVDLVIAKYSSTNYYFNDGSGNFSLQGSISEGGPRHIEVFDYNQDGLQDLTLSDHYNTYLVENQGGSFASPLAIDTFNYAYAIDLKWGDLDNDGDPDLASTRRKPGDMAVQVFENQSGILVKSVLSNSLSNPEKIELVDVNEDNLLDILIPSSFNIQQFINQGNFTFIESEFSVQLNNGSHAEVLATHLDNDADIDILALDRTFDIIYWYEVINTHVSIDIYDTICPGDSMLYGGTYYSNPGSYTNTSNPDTTLNIQINWRSSYSDTTIAQICQGDSLFFAGAFYSTSGTYLDSQQTQYGCDSVSTLFLTVLPVYQNSISQSICQGDSFLFMGNYFSTSGTYSDTLTTSAGCDSVVTLQLTVNPTYSQQLYDTICPGDSVFFNGNYVSESGTYSDTLMTYTGCDSVIHLHLYSFPLDTLAYTIDSVLNDSFYLTFQMNNLQSIWANGDTLSNAVLPANNYEITWSHTHCTFIDSLALDVDLLEGDIWPGDVTNDGIVFWPDFFHLAINFGASGPSRPQASTEWKSQWGPDWNDTLSIGVDKKHADCDGDGFLRNIDMHVVQDNFLLTHAKSSSMFKSTAEVPISMTIEGDSINPGDDFDVSIRLGDLNGMPNGVHAFGVEIDYSSLGIDSFTLSAANSWLGVSTTDLVEFLAPNPSEGKLFIGLSRTDFINVSGMGEILRFTVHTNKDDFISSNLSFELVGGEFVNKQFNQVDVGSSSDQTYAEIGVIKGNPSSISEPLQSSFLIYPNPCVTNCTAKVFSPGILQVYTVGGKKIFENSSNSKAQVDLPKLSPGNYFIKLITPEKTEVKQMVITR